MRRALVLLSFIVFAICLNGQGIAGTILDSENETPLEYASVGIVHTRFGTISDQKGQFHLELPDLNPESMVRISMIGYKPQTFRLGELLNRDSTLRLVVDPFPIAELTITPLDEPYHIGTTRYSRLGNWCGWGGSRFGKGHEIGTRFDLGNEPVHVRKLHVHVHRQAYDTIWYRVHIRTLKDEVPDRELLTNNVIVAIDQEKGWVEMDLATYNIQLDGEVAITLEWLKISGINEDRAMKINDKITYEYLLLNTKKNQGSIYTRWGTEANWEKGDGNPAMYLTVQK